jgi:hypothetical protein
MAARLYTVQEYRLPFPPLINLMYCVRVSLRTEKYSLRNTKEKEVVGNLCISLPMTNFCKTRFSLFWGQAGAEYNRKKNCKAVNEKVKMFFRENFKIFAI